LPNLHAFVEKSTAPAENAPARRPQPAPAPQPPSTAAAPETTPSDPRVAMQAAATAMKRGDFARARGLYQGIVDRNPSDSEAVAGLGDVARVQGDPAGAIAAYKRAIAINPSYLPALLGIADTTWSRGDHATAAKVYADIVDRFPEGTYPAYVPQRAEGDLPAKSPTTAPSATAPSPGAFEVPTTPGETSP